MVGGHDGRASASRDSSEINKVTLNRLRIAVDQSDTVFAHIFPH